MRFPLTLTVLLSLAVAGPAAQQPTGPRTHAEITGFEATSSYADVLRFVNDIVEARERATVLQSSLEATSGKEHENVHSSVIFEAIRREGEHELRRPVSALWWSGVAAGIRRIEAVTGEGALAWVQQQEAKLLEAASVLKAPVSEVSAKLSQVLDNVRALERELAKLKSRLASSQGEDLVSQAVDVKGAKVLAATVDGADAKTLREAMDKLKDRLKSAAIVLGAVHEGRVSLIAGVTPDLTAKLKAGELVNFVAQQVGGKGGGRPDMAQAGGTEPAKLPGALQSVKNWVEQRV